MEYRFKVKQCENCRLDLKGVEPEDVEERSGQLTGYCPKCYVAYPVAEVKTSKLEPEPEAPVEKEPEPEPEPPVEKSQSPSSRARHTAR